VISASSSSFWMEQQLNCWCTCVPMAHCMQFEWPSQSQRHTSPKISSHPEPAKPPAEARKHSRSTQESGRSMRAMHGRQHGRKITYNILPPFLNIRFYFRDSTIRTTLRCIKTTTPEKIKLQRSPSGSLCAECIISNHGRDSAVLLLLVTAAATEGGWMRSIHQPANAVAIRGFEDRISARPGGRELDSGSGASAGTPSRATQVTPSPPLQGEEEEGRHEQRQR
jgi:hypothetical protein